MYLNMNYSISPTVVLQTIDDESLLMDEKTRLFYELNSSGAFFWETLKQHDNFQDAFNDIQDYFDVSKEQLEKDFNNFISSLEEQGMLEVHEAK